MADTPKIIKRHSYFVLNPLNFYSDSSNLSPPVGPGLDFFVQIVAGAFGGTDLTMTVHSVVGGNITLRYQPGDQFLSLGNLGGSGGIIVVVTNEHNAIGFAVPAGGMGTHDASTTTFIDVAIGTDTIVIANISPAQRVHVIGLHVAHLSTAGGEGVAVGTS